MENTSIILLEFNELCPELLDRWIEEGKLPNFRTFRDNSEVFTTYADADNVVNLEPWIQWYSVHTGLSCEQHEVFHLTDGPKAGHKDIWRILLENGRSVGNCGSMNAKGFSDSGSFFLPDPWCTSEEAHPPELGTFHRLVAQQVQEYTNRDKGMGLSTYASFLWFLATHGLRFSTVSTIVRQLAGEVLSKGATSWKRVSLLDQLQFDIFRWYHKRLRPQFATFFINSTAHYQHAYWRHMQPQHFEVQPSQEEIDRYAGAVLYGYQQMDRLLGGFFRLAGNETHLILATAMSQQFYLKKEASGGQRFYRPRSVEKLLEDLEIECESIHPIMAHEYLVSFKTDEEAQAAKEKLRAVACEGEPVFQFDTSDPGTVYFSNQISRPLPEDVELSLGSGRRVPYSDVFYLMDEMKSGFHHPDGVLWFRNGSHRVHERKVSVLDIFPTILDRLGVPLRGNGHSYRGTVLPLSTGADTGRTVG